MENDLHQPPFQERNPITHRVHKREVFWQITLPVIIGAVIVLLIAVVVVLTTARGTGNTSDWEARRPFAAGRRDSRGVEYRGRRFARDHVG